MPKDRSGGRVTDGEEEEERVRGAYILGADVGLVVEEEAGGVRVAAVRRVVERHAAIPLTKGGGSHRGVEVGGANETHAHKPAKTFLDHPWCGYLYAAA